MLPSSNRCLLVNTVLLQMLMLGCLASSAVAQSSAKLPNIVLLYADDMGYGDLGVQNPDSKIPTPHLDRLAATGTRFTDAHSSSGICTPSRYALLQGRYHWRKFHKIVDSFDPSVLDPERTTLPELMKSQGYRTACLGKWHLGWDWKSIMKPGAKGNADKGYPPEAFDWSKSIPDGPLAHGFDEYFGDDVPNFPPYAWIENDRVLEAPTVWNQTTDKTAEGNWEARPGPAVANWDYWNVMPTLTERAEKWITAQSPSKPFFLYFAFTSPHAPIVPDAPFRGSSSANGYGDFMVQTDATVGAVMAALKKANLDQNTLIIFTSDNGPEQYAYERVRKYGHRSMGPLRGLKRDLWEGGHRVPFIVNWPGVVPSGRVCDQLLSQIDIYATLAQTIGAKIPQGSAGDSYNQWPLWTGGEQSARTTLIHNTYANGYALRHQQWLLIRAKTGAVTKMPEWFAKANDYQADEQAGALYDLSSDLGQHHNLYDQMPDKVQELDALLDQIKSREQTQ